jgi:hypothetical protein
MFVGKSGKIANLKIAVVFILPVMKSRPRIETELVKRDKELQS